MIFQLRHSHIAVRRPIGSLARIVNAELSVGEDDPGKYKYFDLIVSHEDRSSQHIRFASHHGDRMVHLLAERIDLTSDLAAALFAVGVKSATALSISTDQNGHPVRSADVVLDRITAMSMSSESGNDRLEIVVGHSGRHPSLPRISMH